MTEKATGREWDLSVNDDTIWDGGDLICILADKPNMRERGELIVKAVNNYDELASIACEMAGALNTTLNEIRINYGTPTREGFYCGDFGDEWTEQIDTLSRYTAFMEGKG